MNADQYDNDDDKKKRREKEKREKKRDERRTVMKIRSIKQLRRGQLHQRKKVHVD